MNIEVYTPEDIAAKFGWSPRHIRKLAREIGACRLMGNRMVLLSDDVQAILEASKPCPSQSTSAVKSGTSGVRLPVRDYEGLQALRTKKQQSELQLKKKPKSGKVILMAPNPS